MALRLLYRIAEENEDVTENPCRGLKLPRVKNERPVILDSTEAIRRISVLRDGDQALYSTALWCGLRMGSFARSDADASTWS